MDIIKELEKRALENPFFHLTGRRDEKKYLTKNNCSLRKIFGYGGTGGEVTDKKTGKKILLPIY